MLYLDHAATTPMRPEATEAMAPYLGDDFGNPSGVHGAAQRAKNAVEEAREQLAELLGVRPLEVVFTGSGTEADNLAVIGGARGGGVVTTAIEHDAVLASARHLAEGGGRVTVIGSEPDGRVDAEKVAAEVDADTSIVSVMAANNETGVRQPVAEIAGLVGDRALVHCDAVQAFASDDVSLLGTDMITLSAHKFGGPKGVGLLTVPEGIDVQPVIHGGGQELGRRSGTHNVAGIVGMAAAARAAAGDRERFGRDTGDASDRLQRALVNKVGAVVNGTDDRLPQHCNATIPGVAAETLLIRLDSEGIAASSGSACHSGAIEPSHVLLAMGLDPTLAAETVRFTFGWDSKPADGDLAAGLVVSLVEELR